jgi:hypothetical protein
MRNLVVAIAGLALLSSLPASSRPAAPQAPAPASQPAADKGTLEDTLVALEKQSWEAWKNHDGKFFRGFLSDDHVELGFGGPANKATVVAGVAGPACSVKSYTVDHFAVAVVDANVALVTYHAAQDTTCGGQPVPSPVWVSSLYVKRDGRWLNFLYQQTKTPK